MAHIVRRCTTGKAQALANDLRENLAKHFSYDGLAELERDKALLKALSAWITIEDSLEA